MLVTDVREYRIDLKRRLKIDRVLPKTIDENTYRLSVVRAQFELKCARFIEKLERCLRKARCEPAQALDEGFPEVFLSCVKQENLEPVLSQLLSTETSKLTFAQIASFPLAKLVNLYPLLKERFEGLRELEDNLNTLQKHVTSSKATFDQLVVALQQEIDIRLEEFFKVLSGIEGAAYMMQIEQNKKLRQDLSKT